MSDPRQPITVGPGYRKYFTPKVSNRLVDYYASDAVFAEIQETIAIAAALPGLVDQLPTLDFDALNRLQDREPILTPLGDDLAIMDSDTGRRRLDMLTDMIEGPFFTKIADLVGISGNLLWYGAVPQLSAFNTFYDNRTSILGVATELGPLRTALKNLANRDGDLLDVAGLAPIRSKLDDLGIWHPNLRDFMGDATGLSESLRGRMMEQLTIAWAYDFWVGPTVHFQAWYVDQQGTPWQTGYAGEGEAGFETWIRTMRWLVDVKMGRTTVPGGKAINNPLEDAMIVFVQGIRSVFRGLLYDGMGRIRDWSDTVKRPELFTQNLAVTQFRRPIISERFQTWRRRNLRLNNVR